MAFSGIFLLKHLDVFDCLISDTFGRKNGLILFFGNEKMKFPIGQSPFCTL